MKTHSFNTGAAVYLVSPSKTPCGVETFARQLARIWAGAGHHAPQIALSGSMREIRQVWCALRDAQALVVNAPVVAWKRVLLLPLVCLLMARLRGRDVVQILHEWGDLDPRRRAVLSVYLLLATHVLYSSPSVRAQHRRTLLARLLPAKTGLVPIPPNIAPPDPAFSRAASHPAVAQLAAARAAGRLVLGHFGSIYRRKRSDRVLEIAAELKQRGHNVLLAYIGDFIRGSEDVETAFQKRIAVLGLADNVLITGYIDSHADVYAALGETDALVYTFAEGLTSRRGSVLAALLSGRPVIVNRPSNAGEFDHHPAFRQALATEALRLVDDDDIRAYADAIESADQAGPAPASLDFVQCWSDAAAAFAAVLDSEEVYSPIQAAVAAD